MDHEGVAKFVILDVLITGKMDANGWCIDSWALYEWQSAVTSTYYYYHFRFL